MKTDSTAKRYTIKRITMGEKAVKSSIKESLISDLPIQRGDVWPDEKQSLLIHSVLKEYPIPPLFCSIEGDKRYVLDGKQRLNALTRFTDNKLKIHKKTPDVDDVKIAGLTFSKLPENLQKSFLDFTIDIYEIENMNAEERDTIFYRYNQGEQFTQLERSKILYYGPEMDKIVELSNHPFFSEKVCLSERNKKHKVNEEIVIQSLMVLKNDDTGLSSKDIGEYLKDVKEKGLSDDTVSIVQGTADYLNQVFDEESFKKDEGIVGSLPIREVVKDKKRGKKTSQKELDEKYEREMAEYNAKFTELNSLKRNLKKVHIPIIFRIALQAKDSIEPKKFRNWLAEFFEKNSKDGVITAYNEASTAGSAKKDHVKARINEMQNSYNEMFASK